MSLVAITRSRAAALLFDSTIFCMTTKTAYTQTNAAIHLAVFPSENAAEPYYAKDMGFFAKAGIDADIQQMQGASAIAAAVASNAIDIGFGTVDTLAAIHAKTVPLVIIAPTVEYVSPLTAGISALVVPETSLVHQAKDLNGKIVAVPLLHSIAEIATQAWIDSDGGTSATLQFVEVPLPAMPAALDAGRIDAAFVAEPFLEAAKRNGRIFADCYPAISRHFLIAGWFTTPQWAKEHPDLVNRFAAVMHDTAVWANRNPAKSGDILAKYTKIDPGVISTMARSRYAEQLTPGLMQPLIDVAAKYEKFSSFPAQELIYVPTR